MTNFNEKQLRNALGTFATGITVVTALNSKGQPVGITVNSFTSVSLNPPLILWCLDNEADSYEVFSTCNNFAVHVLHDGQQDISQRFSVKNNNKFAELEWGTGKFGSPVLNDYSSCLQCELEDRYAGGDHIILLGRVKSVDIQPDKQPLLYHQGEYRLLRP